jgi:geranylgeranyl diphosphate synthase type II
VKAYINLIELLNKHISDEHANLASKMPHEMYEPMAYILNLGGKRIRPLLTLVGCDLFNQNSEKAIPAALSVELFHNFSLIHDDILDNAPLRRGNATVHEKWNTNIAILSGDGMMVKAFEILSKSNNEHVVPLLKLFTKTGLEVCEGQQLDMNFETSNNVTVDEYIHMITFKTAVLLGCSLQMGAICANASEEDQKHLYEFGKHVGVAFQILDDVLDVYADDSKFGKQVGGDIISNKKTFLLLKAFELADSNQKSNLLKELNNSNSESKIKAVTSIYNQLNIKVLSTIEADKHTQIALTHLNKIQANTEKKEHLKEFAIHLLNRDL